MNNMNIAVVDTETTGLDPEAGSIVELAVVTVPSMRIYHSLVSPEHPIEIQAMAIHHITERMIMSAPKIEKAIADCFLNLADVIVAHSAGFDKGFLRIDKPWVCTWRCARQIWPDAPGYSNQILRYWLPDLDEEVCRNREIMALPPHRAAPDAWVTAHILKRMLKEHSIDDLIEMTPKPILMKIVSFGKHRGEKWEDVPKRYLRWMIEQDFDDDTKFTAKHHLGDLKATAPSDKEVVK